MTNHQRDYSPTFEQLLAMARQQVDDAVAYASWTRRTEERRAARIIRIAAIAHGLTQ